MVRELFRSMFYASAYYELTGIPVTKLITLMVTPDGEVKVFDKRNKGDYICTGTHEFVILKNLSLTILGQNMKNEIERFRKKAFEDKFIALQSLHKNRTDGANARGYELHRCDCIFL